MTDINRVRELAGKASPSPWRAEGASVQCNDTGNSYLAEAGHGSAVVGLSSPRGWQQRDNDVAYIAAVHPAYVTALLDRLERAEKALAKIAAGDGLNDPDVLAALARDREPT